MIRMLVFLAGIVAAQSFEVASIRRVDTSLGPPGAASKGPVPLPKGVPPPPPGRIGPGRFSLSNYTYILVLRALEIPVCADALRGGECPRLAGGPGWIRKEAYAIEATLPAGAAQAAPLQPADLNAMLLTLLQDRFALQTHRESGELPAFALTVNRGGHKLTPAQGPLTRSLALGPFAAPNGVRMWRMSARNQSMQEIAQGLSFFLDRPVVDRTGLSGKFDFELEYEADPDNPGPGAEVRGPALATALAEQAGLRLESTRASVEVVVIDSIERPSEN